MTVSLSAVPAPVRVSDTRFPISFVVDPNAVRQACKRLGVRQPVVIAFAEYRRGRMLGSHSATKHGHAIAVWYGCDAGEASRVLWHELTHAAQQEAGRQCPGGTGRVRREQGEDAYLNHPNEVEACANERLHLELELAR